MSVVTWLQNNKKIKKENEDFKKQIHEVTDAELLKNFRSENWAKLSTAKRLTLVQEVENRNATMQGRVPCTVNETTAVGNYGSYYSECNEIEINVQDYISNNDGSYSNNNSYQVLDSIFHEGEHAYQDYCVKNKIDASRGLPQTTRDMCKIENARITRSNINLGSGREYTETRFVVDPKDGNIQPKVIQKKLRKGDFYNYKKRIDYSNCTCEIDSNNVAAKRVLQNQELFRDDAEYKYYLQDREKYFERVASKDMSEVRMQQREAVNESLNRGDIDIETHDNILLNEIGYTQDQPAFVEAKEMCSQIKQAQLEISKTIDQKKDEEHNELTLEQDVQEQEDNLEEEYRVKRR